MRIHVYIHVCIRMYNHVCMHIYTCMLWGMVECNNQVVTDITVTPYIIHFLSLCLAREENDMYRVVISRYN